MNFSGVLPRGTPVAQCIPVKREKWAVRTAAFTSEDTRRAYEQMTEVAGEQGVYRRRFRA